jgi:hypothetical protein
VIHVHDHPGQGCSFVIDLPRAMPVTTVEPATTVRPRVAS